ncbi:MAG: hypothetical protein WD767_06470 [Alphaproteobacteria bacterium]
MNIPDNIMEIALHACAVVSVLQIVATFLSGEHRTLKARKTLFLTIPFLGFYVYLMLK